MKRVALLTAIILLTISLVAVVWQLHGVLLIFILSLAIAATLGQPVELLVERGWKRGLAIGFVYLTGFALLLGLAAAVTYFMVWEIDPLVRDLVRVYGNAQHLLAELANPRTAWVTRLPTTDQIARWWAGDDAPVVIQNIAHLLQHTGRLITELVLSVFLSLYWMVDRNRFERLWFSLLPAEPRMRARRMWRKLEADVGAYMRSELLQTMLAIVLFAAGYALLGIKYPVTLAVVAGVAWLVPLLGGLLALLPVLIVGLLTSPLAALSACAYTLVVLFILEFYVQRRLYTEGRYWGVLLVAIMLAMADTFGLVGLILAPPIALAIQIVINEILNSPAPVAASVQKTDLAALQQRLAEVRSRVASEGAAASPRLLNLVGRLETLIAEVEDNGVNVESSANRNETLLAGKLPLDLVENNA